MGEMIKMNFFLVPSSYLPHVFFSFYIPLQLSTITTITHYFMGTSPVTYKNNSYQKVCTRIIWNSMSVTGMLSWLTFRFPSIWPTYFLIYYHPFGIWYNKEIESYPFPSNPLSCATINKYHITFYLLASNPTKSCNS